jgi:hypothetical protein
LQGSPNQAKWAKFSPYVSWNHSLDSKVKLKFLFASCSLLVNNLCFMVKLIDKAIVINIKIHKERKRLYSSNKENLSCRDKSITAISKFVLTKFQVKIKSKI